MIRTAILAGILLVMISMALNRPGVLPAFERPVEPVVSAAPEIAEPVRAEAPRVQPASAPAAKAEVEPEPAVVAPVEEETDVAAITPEPVVIAPPAREVPPPVKAEAMKAEPGRPLSLMPDAQVASTQPREPVRLMPLVSDNMPAPPAPTLPPVQEAQASLAPLPEVNVPTRPVMVPRDFASRLMPENVTAAEESAPIAPSAPAAPAPQLAEARAPTIAPGTKFMSPEERSRELYRLAREMEDTFIQKLTQ